MSVTPSTKTWVLRLKMHRTTFVLHAEPTMKLSSLKEDLLEAASQSVIPGTPNNADDIILGKLIDRNDVHSGWEVLDSGKGKGKVSPTLQNLELFDGAILAVQFNAGVVDEWDVEFAADEPLTVEMKDIEVPVL